MLQSRMVKILYAIPYFLLMTLIIQAFIKNIWYCVAMYLHVVISTDKAEVDSLKLKQYTTLSRLVHT